MRLSRAVAMTVVTIFAVGLATSGSAFGAEANPKWASCSEKAGGKFTESACKTEGSGGKFELSFLGAGEKGEVEAEANGAQKLKSVGISLVCKRFKEKANVKGSEGNKPGTAESTAEESECEVEKSPECKINGEVAGKAKITTKPLKQTLAFETKAAAENSEKEKDVQTVLVTEPAEGKTLAELELSGTGCPVTGKVKAEGSYVVRMVKKGNEEHASKQELEAPETPITSYFVNEGAKTVEKKAELKALGVKATYIGRSFLWLFLLIPWWVLCLFGV
jgi:hypothetical protein